MLIHEQDAAAEAAKIAGGAKGLADNDRDSKHSDDRRTSRGNGFVVFVWSFF